MTMLLAITKSLLTTTERAFKKQTMDCKARKYHSQRLLGEMSSLLTTEPGHKEMVMNRK